MPGFDQAPAKKPEAAEDPVLVRRRVRLGYLLFVIYTALYGGFMLLNTFSPKTMEQTPLGGVNIAILYGLGLIAAAFLLALLFEGLCRWIARDGSSAKESR